MSANGSGTITASGAANAVALTFAKPDEVAMIGLSGTFGTVTMKVEAKGLDGLWYPVACVDVGSMLVNVGGTAFSLTDNTNKALMVNVAGFIAVRIYANAIASGTVAVQLATDNFSMGPAVVASVDTTTISASTAPITIAGTNANALDVGQNGATNPALQVDTSTASSATGVKLKSNAAASGMAISVISSGADENLTVDAKGTGTISIASVSTGAVTLGANTGVTGTLTVTSANASALTVGRQGATSPGLQVDASTGSCVTGIKIKPAAAAAGCAVSVVSSGTNENLTVDAKGSGTISIATVSTGAIVLGAATGVTGALTVTSAGASAISAGLNGSTNPAIQVDASTASSATGLKVKSAAAAAGCAVSVISSGTNEALTLDAKGSGTISIATVSTGAITLGAATGVTGALTVTSAGASAISAGLNGATNPALQVDASTASSATGVKVKSAAAAGGVAVSVISSGTNENLTIDAKGSGTITLGSVSTGNVVTSAPLSVLNLQSTPGASTAAAGTTTADAGVLPAATSVIYPTTAADGTKGVRIHANDKVTGRTIFIGNGVSNAVLKVYAPSGGTINGASADVAFSGASGKGVLISCLDSSGNTWLAM